MTSIHEPPSTLCKAIAESVGCSPMQAHAVAAHYLDEGTAYIDPTTGRPRVKRGGLDHRSLLNAIAVVSAVDAY